MQAHCLEVDHFSENSAIKDSQKVFGLMCPEAHIKQTLNLSMISTEKVNGGRDQGIQEINVSFTK